MPSDPIAPGAQPPSTCVARWTLSSSEGVLHEQRGVAPMVAWSDFPTKYPAAAIDPKGLPVATVARFVIDGQPLLWFSEARTEAVVDARWFSELALVDATALSTGATATIGTFLPAGRCKIAPRELVEFLVRADAVRTYAHIGSEVCLASEAEADGAYTATFTGEHVYFTNEENRASLAFVVTVAADGTITVTGT